MEYKAIRIHHLTKNVMIDEIPDVDPADVRAWIEHYSTMDSYLILAVHDNKVSTTRIFTNYARLDHQYEFDKSNIQRQFVPITRK